MHARCVAAAAGAACRPGARRSRPAAPGRQWSSSREAAGKGPGTGCRRPFGAGDTGRRAAEKLWREGPSSASPQPSPGPAAVGLCCGTGRVLSRTDTAPSGHLSCTRVASQRGSARLEETLGAVPSQDPVRTQRLGMGRDGTRRSGCRAERGPRTRPQPRSPCCSVIPHPGTQPAPRPPSPSRGSRWRAVRGAGPGPQLQGLVLRAGAPRGPGLCRALRGAAAHPAAQLLTALRSSETG